MEPLSRLKRLLMVLQTGIVKPSCDLHLVFAHRRADQRNKESQCRDRSREGLISLGFIHCRGLGLHQRGQLHAIYYSTAIRTRSLESPWLGGVHGCQYRILRLHRI